MCFFRAVYGGGGGEPGANQRLPTIRSVVQPSAGSCTVQAQSRLHFSHRVGAKWWRMEVKPGHGDTGTRHMDREHERSGWSMFPPSLISTGIMLAKCLNGTESRWLVSPLVSIRPVLGTLWKHKSSHWLVQCEPSFTHRCSNLERVNMFSCLSDVLVPDKLDRLCPGPSTSFPFS